MPFKLVALDRGYACRRLRFLAVLAALPLGAAWCPDKVEPSAPIISSKPIEPLASTVSVPVSVSLKQVRDLLENQIPHGDGVAPYNLNLNGGADNCGNGVSLGYSVQRSPVSLSANGNTLVSALGFSYWVQARARPSGPFGICGPLVGGSCGVGEPLRTGSVSFGTALAIDKRWHVISQTNAAPAAAGNHCQVTFLNYDVTDQVMRAFNAAFAAGAQKLDDAVRNAGNAEPRMQQLWSTLSQPIAIDKDTWLVVQPQSAGVTQLAGTNDAVTLTAMMKAKPEIVIGPKPSGTTAPLPDNAPGAGGNAFNIQLPVDVSYAFIDSVIAKEFNLGTGGLRYPATGKYFVHPTGVEIYGYGTQAVVRVAFDGSAKGWLYLVGTPHFDAGRNVLSFPDLDYTLQTKNLLLKLVNWKEQDRVLADLRGRLTFDLSRQVAAAKTFADKAINRSVGPVALSGNVAQLTILGLYADPEHGQFRALGSASGTLNAVVQ